MTEGKLRATFIWRLCRCGPLGLRAASFARRVGSLSGTSLPPTGGAPWPSDLSGAAARPCGPYGAPHGGVGGGFAALEASPRRVAGVSRLYWCNSPRLLVPSTWADLDRAPLTAQFSPFAGGEIEVRGGEDTVWGSVVPKVQTTSATNADNRVLWARQSAFWAQRCLAWCVACTRTPEHAR